MKKKHLLKPLVIGGTLLVIYTLLLLALVSAEKGRSGASITDPLDSIWFSVVTLTGVGYGDKTPVTLVGKIISLIFILSSLVVLGYLVGRISTSIYKLRNDRLMGYGGTVFREHIVIIGWNKFSASVVRQLQGTGFRVAVVTENRNDIELIKEMHDRREVFLLYADFNNFEILEKANIRYASVVFINFGRDSEKLVYLINCRKHFPGTIRYAIVPDNDSLSGTFLNAGAEIVLARNRYASRITASYIHEPDVAELCEELLSTSRTPGSHDIKEYFIPIGNPLIGRSYGDLFFSLQEKYRAILIGLARNEEGHRLLIQNPPLPGPDVRADDRLIMIVSGRSAEMIEHHFGIREGYHERT